MTNDSGDSLDPRHFIAEHAEKAAYWSDLERSAFSLAHILRFGDSSGIRWG
jgi:hypothetical protein